MAKHFIHIATESTDPFFLGMLHLKFFEEDIDIKIAVWHPQRLYQPLGRLWNSSISLKGYRLKERIFTRGISIDTISEVHQKLIIVDGYVAFKGSANATLAGWTRKGEIIEFATEPSEVRELNNKFFAEFRANKRKMS